jgi:group I intron endonuclease
MEKTMNEIMFVYGVIYKITNLINGKIYIGQAIHDIQERLNGHIKQAEKFEASQQMLIARAIKKYGKENFIIEVISSAFNKNELNFKERFYKIPARKMLGL